MYVDVLKRDAFLSYSIFFSSFFKNNIRVMKTYLCVHFCDCWPKKIVFLDLLYIFVRLSSIYLQLLCYLN